MSDDRAHRLSARALGVLSAGLGAAALLAPHEAARRAGLRDDDRTLGLVRAVGVRELLVVPGLLRAAAPAGWLRVRVLGDLVDLALLGSELDEARGARRELLARTTTAVVGLTVLDLLAARRSARASTALRLTAAITVKRPADEVYAVWRDLRRLPTFMTHLEEVRPTSDTRSVWQAAAPVGRISWEAEITEDVPGRRLAWRSVGRTPVPNSGSVVFTAAPGDRGTEVRVHLEYAVPLGRLGARVARLLGEEPHQQVEDDLRRFKQVVETGEVVRSDGSPEGTAARRQLLQRPAAPVRQPV